MNKVFEKVKLSLIDLSKDIEDKAFDKKLQQSEWGGADVFITSQKEKDDGDSFYPQPRKVFTPFSKQVSWLFEHLRDAFSGLIDGTSKIEFYGRLANAAAMYQKSVNGDGNAQDILRAVLYEAVIMLEEMEEGTFDYLDVAVGNTILADMVDEAEESGYIGVEATGEFFKKMEEKHL